MILSLSSISWLILPHPFVRNSTKPSSKELGGASYTLVIFQFNCNSIVYFSPIPSSKFPFNKIVP